jgi:hypothetical protein
MALVTRTGKGSKLTIAEMDGNLEYLEELSQPLESLIKFSATTAIGFDNITNLVNFKNTALITPGNVTDIATVDLGSNALNGYNIRLTTTLPNAANYDWVIEVANTPSNYTIYKLPLNTINYSTQNLASGIIGNVEIYKTQAPGFDEYFDNITVRVTAKLS